MFRKISLILAALLFVVSSSIAFADADEAIDNMKTKIQRGAVNTFTGWMEIPAQIHKGFEQGFRGDENNKLAGVVTGGAEGALAATGRTISGVVDLIGCWALSPASNDGVGIPTEAEYAWEKGNIYDLETPNLQEATFNPIGEKVKRGLANTVFGIAEIPDHIAKGVKEGSFGWGVDKAIWHFLSRELSGVYDLVTVCFPTPQESIGYNFEKEWPWTDLCKE